MTIDPKTVEKTATLANLDLTWGLSPEEAPAALAKLAGEMDNIVSYMDILAEADTSGVEPLYSPMIEPQMPREDIPQNSGLAEDLLNQSPERWGDFFTVPKII